ncbi:phage terminase large subunit family protein [Streptomyces sp. NPDC050095]|uniref:phage terminase large subunit family protein n=1 Tax=unclassified Streptomyces TaxID=2593676 RepID=UPI00342B393E
MGAPARYATPRDLAYRTYGGKVAKIATAMGMPLMPWQRQVADVASEVDDDGRYRYPVVVLTVPRQSGKTSLLRPVIAHRGLTVRKAGLFLTAQQRQDAADIWTDTADLLDDSPLARLIRRRDTNGQECLKFEGTGAKLRIFNALSRRALHGKTSDLVFIDEAFSFTDEQGDVILQAVVPTQATRKGAQVWIVSTAGTAASTWLRRWVLKGRAAVEAGGEVAYFEWSIPEDTEDLEDLEVYERWHPAVGHTIDRRALVQARSMMKSHEFARAYGNFWVSSDEWAIAPAVWDPARTIDPLIPGDVSFGVEVAADRSCGSIVACGRLADGRRAVELVEHRGGVGWIAPRVLELCESHRPVAVVVDPTSPAGAVHRALADNIKSRGRWVPLADFGTTELCDAQVEFLDDLTGRRLAHRASVKLDAAVRATGVRVVREQEVFSRIVAEDGTAPAPLLAAVLAAYGLAHPVPNEKPALSVAAG